MILVLLVPVVQVTGNRSSPRVLSMSDQGANYCASGYSNTYPLCGSPLSSGKGFRQVDPNDFTILLHIPLLQAVARYRAPERSLGKLRIPSRIIRCIISAKDLFTSSTSSVTHHLTKALLTFRERWSVPASATPKGPSSRTLRKRSSLSRKAALVACFRSVKSCIAPITRQVLLAVSRAMIRYPDWQSQAI